MPESLKDNMKSTPSLWQENYTYHKTKGDLEEFITMRYRELHNIYTVVFNIITYDEYKKTVQNAMEEVQKLRQQVPDWVQLSNLWNEAMGIKKFLMKKGSMGGNSRKLRDLNRQITKLKL